MGELKVATIKEQGSSSSSSQKDVEVVILDETVMETFQNSLRGKLILPTDVEDYNDARTLFNAMFDKRPAFIVRCAGAADVVAAVKFAREHHLLTSIRGTGHNVTGNAVCDNGMVIDLSHMKGMRIDVAAQTVWAEPGLTWGELNHDLQVFGLTVTGGFISTTGVGGLTLGGGLGWLIRKHGLACDNLLAADVVTASGQLLTASETQNPDLFWAIRGGGGNFGVITSFQFRVHPAGIVLAGMLAYPIDDRAKEAIQTWRDFTLTAPEELSSGFALGMAPPAPFVPNEMQGSPIVAIAGVYCGDIDTGEKIIQPLREAGSPMFDIFQPMPCDAAQSMMDNMFPWGYRNYWKGNILTGITNEAIDVLLANFDTVPSPMTLVIVEHNGDGAMDRVSSSDTAFGHRDWTYDIIIMSIWSDEADDEKNMQWTRTLFEVMQPFSRDAVYVNYLGEEGEERVKSAYSKETYERLVKLKNKYDPTNLFRLNQNIKPTV